MKPDRSQVLTDVVERLSMSNALPSVTGVIAEAARNLTGADGATFVLRDNDKCYYVDEDAISPLWKGRRFPLEACISGWSMVHRQVVVIEDIYQDIRIPHDAYRPTFVKSLCMIPIRVERPLGAIGCYWSSGYIPNAEEVKLLQVLANSAAIGLENLQLKKDLLDQVKTQGQLSDLEEQFETAIHTMAHDLRNPISTMMLFTELVQSSLAGKIDARLSGYLNSIMKTGMHASEQIKKMLALYSVANHEVEKEELFLSSIVEEITTNLCALYKERKIQVEVEPHLRVHADPHLMRLALENLLSNAFKYTAKKSRALIRFKKVDEDPSSVTFLVEDNGAGFAPTQSHLLFRPMMRLHDESEFLGTGLGLASVARILELHGGSVRAEGQVDHGAKFYFTLPRISA